MCTNEPAGTLVDVIRVNTSETCDVLNDEAAGTLPSDFRKRADER